MRDVALGSGSNLGDSARDPAGPSTISTPWTASRSTAVSGVFETDPVGGPEQGVYLNAVVLGRTSLGDPELLVATQSVEQALASDAGRAVGSAHAGHRHPGDRVRGHRVRAISSSRTRERTSGPSSSSRGSTWTPVPSSQGAGRSRDLVAAVDTSGVRRTGIRLDVAEQDVQP